jgi:hypothetical protein
LPHQSRHDVIHFPGIEIRERKPNLRDSAAFVDSLRVSKPALTQRKQGKSAVNKDPELHSDFSEDQNPHWMTKTWRYGFSLHRDQRLLF